RSTVAQRIDALMSAGLVVEVGGAPSTGGRPPSLLGFNAEAGLVLAADLGATHSRVAVCNLLAETLAETTAEIDINSGPEAVLGWLEETFDGLLAEMGRSAREVRGIGVGVPGPVDFSHGMAVNPPIMAGWHMYPIKRRLTERHGVPVLVDNDVNVMAFGEYWVMDPKVDDFIFVKVGTGIGSGLILGGVLHRGANGAAGDIGHMRATSDDVICRCGNNGCLEASAGGGALAAHLRTLGHNTQGSRDVVRLLEKGNKDATRAVRQAGRLIGQVLASMVNLLNPSLILIGGDLARAEQPLLAGIREVVYQRSTTLSTTDLSISTSSLLGRAGVTGAAALAIDHILTPRAVDEALSGVGASSGAG
ncbi:MAG: ROK family protein, partial [Actinomycetota bacterium]|nr:ROK family protein [Actinomycetota bacterium]